VREARPAKRAARYTPHVQLPAHIGAVDFGERYRLAFDAWRPAVAETCARHGLACDAVTPFADGSNLVAAVDERWVVKLFPPFHRDQWQSEHLVLPRFAGSLPVRVPELVAAGEREDGYTYVVLTRISGESLEARWPRCTRSERVALMSQIGELMAAAHALPAGGLEDLSLPWPEFLVQQIARCRSRHARLRMPDWLVEGVDEFVAGALSALPLDGPHAILTGEYTPFNLLVEDTLAGPRLTGMIDFGDARIGPPVYDVLGPSTFLAGGDPLLVQTLFKRHGPVDWPLRPAIRKGLLALLLLHEFSDLDRQLRIPGWRGRAHGFDALALLVWPDSPDSPDSTA
jgi:hygromycin-B 7''-O-kinase